MKTKMFLLLFFCLVAAGSVTAQGTFEVTYISIEGVYINAGTQDGLHLGDSINIYRNDSLQAIMVITNTASHSSACKIVEEPGKLLVGDYFTLEYTPIASDPTEIKQTVPEEIKDSPLAINQLNGSISFQNYWQNDMTGSSLSYIQPGLVSRIRVNKLGGKDVTLRFRHRSRLNHRSRTLGNAFDTDEWYHRVYELAVKSNRDNDYYWSIGRQTVSEMSGIGFVDGILLAKRISSAVTTGVVVGFEPDWVTTDISFDRKKAGLFVRYEQFDQTAIRYRFQGALVGSYYKSNASREFLSLNNSLSYNKLQLYNSMEVDMYRSWRKEITGKSFSLTNLYLTLRYQVINALSVYASYDRRENIWYYETLVSEDSLFDDVTNQGLKAGYTLKLTKTIRMNGYGGVRFRDGSVDDNKYGSVSLMISRFPKRSNSTALRFSYVKTEFTTGYRPSVMFRFPLTKAVRMTLTNTMYHYSGAGLSRTYYYIDLNGNYYSRSDYFISGSYRQYISEENKSGQLYFEIGLYM